MIYRTSVPNGDGQSDERRIKGFIPIVIERKIEPLLLVTWVNRYKIQRD